MRHTCIAFLVSVLMFMFSCESKKAETVRGEDASPKPVQRNERPDLKVMLQDGRQIDLRTLEEDFVLVLFNPDCDHCHEQAKQIKGRMEAFSKYNLYFVSSQDMEMINEFAKQMELTNQKNVFFGNAASQAVYDVFGPIPTPSTYIYKKDGAFIQSFESLVDVEVIVKYL